MTAAAEPASAATVAVTLRIRRSGPEGERRPRWDEDHLAARPIDHVLDLLDRSAWGHDESRTRRRSLGPYRAWPACRTHGGRIGLMAIMNARPETRGEAMNVVIHSA